MKPSAQPSKTPPSHSDSLHQRLSVYALAAGAAGVGVLALAQPVEARIVFTPIHHVIGKNGKYKLDLNHDKMADFILSNKHGCNTDFCYDFLSAIPAGDNGVEGTNPEAFALKRGMQIGPKAPFSGQFMASSESGQGTNGRWLNVKNGYLGLKFQIKGKTHFGWARLTVQVLGGGLIRATLTGYAYETIANKPIIAGRTKEPDDRNSAELPNPATRPAPALKPATLGLLAMGVHGLPIWRRESVGSLP
jgi:hypothetical protein